MISSQEIADVVDCETPSTVKKHIDRIAEHYEAFINPLPDGVEQAKQEKKRDEKTAGNQVDAGCEDQGNRSREFG